MQVCSAVGIGIAISNDVRTTKHHYQTSKRE